MTLDPRIQKNLTDLYNGGATPEVIQVALDLNGLVQAKPRQTMMEEYGGFCYDVFQYKP